MHFIRILIVACSLALPVAALAQGAQIAFGNVKQDTTKPVEVTADNLAVNQNDGTAVFTGNVLIGQGQMRLSAPKVQVYYNEKGDRIERMKATGGVTLVSGEDAAEASQADYSIDSGMIHMSGDVLLVQKTSAISADRMVVDTKAGTANMQGRVKTVLQQSQ
ncbi:lipopolysaccharide transport periplasmic protein LptA [Alisedimentitalea sp. MJ-SS2]|uniref:lipopolysaccharide transport periplasmic protein LptA n=1 Tax=Aliisedimentitalea sp. MJ-SS2 TaxID=3049795 RepID=UPI0029085ACA|nr:lipopolysaccharide transport periplasmic protein LptA [Alisedimentitalea sp. MJ-SS2]MDU8927827.1 lipopolysaccharide transport periplasmic protein LptA [Alisedimentitalea sp. MJ-SS2]